ncbi:hypothetical protein APICC_07962 [Apis cerana cerana]|uniref:Uncharacterized protein n=1 Tax=Apis cerana cerana TaxID=94128 RepID=A0A2A3EHI1_APICC|nr:hypothetical protein APICC_07962 [Apis cerana cerana]
MTTSSRYSSYNCLTSWDSYDRIPRMFFADYQKIIEMSLMFSDLVSSNLGRVIFTDVIPS